MSYCISIMNMSMELRDAEVFPALKFNEYVLQTMEIVQSVLQCCKAVIHMWVVLCEIDEINQAVGCLGDAWFPDCTNEGTNEHLFQLLVVSCCPLLDYWYSILEMAKSREDRHCTKLHIKVSHPCKCTTLFFEVVFDDALMELVENIQGDAEEDVSICM